MKKRILFLMSDTGGGHRAAAQAIDEAIQYLYPNRYDTFIDDILKGSTPWPINKIPHSYPWLTGPGLPVWRLIWLVTAHFQVYKIVFPLLSPLLKPEIISYLVTIKPDIVVSVHPLLNHLGLRWINQAKLDIPFVTVVTDMVTIHPLWICPRVTRCLVPTNAAREVAIKFGMSPERVNVCGQPVGLKFATLSVDKTTLRRRLGLDLERRTVMIMGGGEGSGRIFDIARAIAQTVPQVQLLIVAGRNKSLQKRLGAVSWEIPSQIYGFVDNMPELMGAADILITKAGPGTISEAFIAGLPLLIFRFLPEQERGNVTYVQEHRAGAYAETPQEIARLVLEWISPANNTLQEMAHNAARLARPQASLAIATKVCDLI